MTPADPRDQPDRADDGAPDAAAAPIGAEVDDQASAALDGTPDHQPPPPPPDPAVAARAAEMAAAREVLRAVPPPDPHRRDRAIDAALAAFDDEADDGSPTVPVAGRPDELATRRADRPARRRAARRLVAAAAALVVVAAVGVAVARSGDDDTTTASDTMDAEGSAGQGGDAEVGEGDSSAGGSTAAPEAGEDPGAGEAPEAAERSIATLGEHASVRSLLDAAAGVDAAVEPQPTADSGFRAEDTLAARCSTGVPGPIAEASDARPVASGTVDGEPIEVWRVRAPGGSLLVAIDDGCRVASSRPVG